MCVGGIFPNIKKPQHSGVECAKEISRLCQFTHVVRSWAMVYVCAVVVAGLLTCGCLSALN